MKLSPGFPQLSKGYAATLSFHGQLTIYSERWSVCGIFLASLCRSDANTLNCWEKK